MAGVLDAISNQYFQLTHSEKRIADYILGNSHQVSHLSISELACECGVADATVSRFCRRIGIGGFNALKLELLEQRGRPHTAPGAEGLPTEYRSVLEDAERALQQTASLLDEGQVQRCLDVLGKASRVVCMGQGSSMIMAEEAWSLFSTLSPKYIFVPDPHLQINTVAMMEPDDAILFFSYSGSTRDFQDISEIARLRRVRVILVTRFLNSPGGKLADIVLQCGANEIPLQAGSVPARMAQLFVLDVLFRGLYQRDRAGAEQYRARISESVTRKHL